VQDWSSAALGNGSPLSLSVFHVCRSNYKKIRGRIKMKSRPQLPKNATLFLPMLAIAVAVGVFVADTLTDSDIIASVMYVAVVLISVRFLSRRGVVFVSLGCMALTIISYLVTATVFTPTGLINTAISLLAVAITTYLAMQIESVNTIAAALTEADALRDAVIGSVSHELRTPLASILGSASILAEMPAITKDPRLVSLVAGIRDEATQLNNDIQNLIDAARIASDGLRSNRDWTEPADIINSAADRVRSRNPSRRIELDIDANLPLLKIDPVLIEQALGQIIANAVKYSLPASTVQVTAKVKNEQITISVIDQGVGLTDEEKERFAERFFRGPRHIGETPGSGLGMWIANTFIVSNGGRLRAMSPGNGQGSTIQIVFPTFVENKQ
jgi:signal transduction histidine kinase